MSRAKKNGEAPTSPTTKTINSTTIVAQKEAQSLTPKEIDTPSTITSKNRFTSFGEFKEFILNSFIDGSGIDPVLLNECIEFHEDVEFDAGMTMETPIHEELGWYYVRFPRQVREPIYAAFLRNEDGSLWQAVISEWVEDKQRPYKYIAPKGCGDRAFLPPVPKKIRQKICIVSCYITLTICPIILSLLYRCDPKGM